MYRRQVQFAETDMAGMVHFSMFFRYMEEAEHAVWRRAGLRIDSPESDLKWPRVSATFDFKRPLRFEDEFEVRTAMGQVTARTIQWSHTIVRGETIVGSGSVTAACAKKQTDGAIKAVEIPEDILAALRASLGV